MSIHGSSVPLLKFQIATTHTYTLLASSGSKRKPKCYCLSNSLVKKPTSRFPNGAPIERLAVHKAFFYISLRFLNKQSLYETKSHLYLTLQRKERPLHVPPRWRLCRQLLRFHNQYIIHSFTASEQIYGGFSTWQDRIYGVMFCMCIDRGYVGTWENEGAQWRCAIGRLFIETALVMVKQNSDLLCHSQLDGSQGCVAMSC